MPSSPKNVKENFSGLINDILGLVYRCTITCLNDVFDENYQYTLTFVSKGAYALLGIHAQDLTQRQANVIENLMYPEDLITVRQEMRDKIVAHEAYSIKYRMLLPSGQTKWIWDRGEATYAEDGTPSTLSGLLMDISEEKYLEIALQEENQRLKSNPSTMFSLGNIVGKSQSMRAVYAMILKAAQTDANVIIYGETGCGKDLVAHAIHDLSNRSGIYVPVNCGAIPEQLMESEFFGHIKGAFSGAYKTQEGYIGAAHNGTLFLDELGELPLHLQVKLLRALENKMYTPVGGNMPKQSSFRLISATNQNLEHLVRDKKMRSDFFYRVNVLSIKLPPLRDRAGDIPLLVDNYMARKKTHFTIPLRVNILMERYGWPGNVRELHNFLDRYSTFGEEVASELMTDKNLDVILADSNTGTTLEEATLRLEEVMIRQALDRCRWKRSLAAEQLGLNLRTLQRKMKKLHI